MKKVINSQDPEFGGAGAKLLLALMVLILLANAGYNYVPVAYQGESFKQELDTAVVQGTVIPTKLKPTDVIKDKVITAIKRNDIPLNSFVEVKEVNKVVHARVAYSKIVPLLPFGAYNYVYTFDYTATPAGYLNKQ
jgi:hypothetical protein